MTGFDAATWETFLRRMVAYNLALFDTTNNSDNNDNNSDNREDKLGKLRRCGAVIFNPALYISLYNGLPCSDGTTLRTDSTRC